MRRLLVIASLTAMGCAPGPLPIGSARTTTGEALTVAAAAFGDDFLQLIAQTPDCSEVVFFRNFPSWQFDSCETCFGKPIGSGILSSSGELCGYASGSGWTSDGDCGARLSVAATTAEEISGTLRIDKSSGGTMSFEFRAARIVMKEQPTASAPASLCDAPGDLGTAACCNSRRDEKCAEVSVRPACHN